MILESHKVRPTIPGRGLVTEVSTKLRQDYLKSLSISTNEISRTNLDLKKVQKNIESFIGAVEIPLGLVGPLLFKDKGHEELVYTAGATLEGALIASMNRGAKAVSLSGGFKAKVLWQKMVRAPMFIFEREKDAEIFKNFIEFNFEEIKKKAESYSNHAQLLELETVLIDEVVHVKFIYSTGDASGQNMTTTCTWHAMIFIADKFNSETGIVFKDFILEGNGSSDKKVSTYSTSKGRGVSVVAECILSEKIINEVLRTSSAKMVNVFKPSCKLAKIDGMFGYNINVANAIAAIYAATGQDLGCIHESSVGILDIQSNEEGLSIKLSLPNLVIGTVGGGTHLLKQSEALEILKCKGSGKIERFAKLIAGFAMSLEISTYAAIVSGEFAKAHEKLGRNKPIDWLLNNELDFKFLKKCLNRCEEEIISIELKENKLLENGILTHIAGRVTKKLVGFETLNLKTKCIDGNILHHNVLMKSKALDQEVIKGLHVIAASIDPELSDHIKKNQNILEYKNCHIKEIEVYSFLHKRKADYIPKFFGEYINESREIYLLLLEYLDPSKLALINSENSPESWKPNQIYDAITTANRFHLLFSNELLENEEMKYTNILFEPWKANELYNKLINLLITGESDIKRKKELENFIDASLSLEQLSKKIDVQKTIIHNDFNSRNVAVRTDGRIVVYDWELAVFNYPHRDIVEFLSFVLKENFTDDEFLQYLEFHYELNKHLGNNRDDWFKAYEYAIVEFIITRVVFYEVAGIVVKYDFSKRILNNALRMLNIIKVNE